MGKFYIYIAMINALDLLAILSGKMWYLKGNPLYLIGCCAGFAGAGFFFALSMKYGDMAIVNVLWIAISIILVALAGVFMFGEYLSIWQWIGMVVVIGGIVLLNVK